VTGTTKGGVPYSTQITLGVERPQPSLSLPPYVTASRLNAAATVLYVDAGQACTWSITNGTLTDGQGTSSIRFTPGASGQVRLSVDIGLPSPLTGTATIVAAPIAELALPRSVHPGDAWMRASIPPQPGASYAWTVVPGLNEASALLSTNTPVLAFAAGATPGTFQVQVAVTNAAGDSTTASATVTAQTGTWQVENGGMAAPALMPR
jgi:hypothetical protein